jgi:hypothetical protein
MPIHRLQAPKWSDLALMIPSVAVALVLGELLLRQVVSRGEIPDRPFASEDTLERELWIKRRSTVALDPYRFDMPDPLLGWRPKPGVAVRAVRPGSYDVVIRIDENGLRAPGPVRVSKPPGISRIGVYGCSQTFGEGVNDEETFSAQLATLLPRTEVLNFGVHGYGTDQMLLAYERDGARYELDAVVVAFAWFHVNRNASRFSFFAKPRFELEQDGALVLTGTPVPDPDTVLASSRSEPARWLDQSILLRWSWQRVINLNHWRMLRPDSPEWALSRALIARFVRAIRARGAVAILANIDERRADLEPALKKLAIEEGAGFVNLGPRLREMSRAEVSYQLVDDPHWNATGHRAIAVELADRLCSTTSRVPCAVEQARPSRDG